MIGGVRAVLGSEQLLLHAKVRTKSNTYGPSRRWDADVQVTAGRIQCDDGVMKYMLVMQLFQKAIDSGVPREYGVPVLPGGRQLCVL
jgi:hypothetical protein